MSIHAAPLADDDTMRVVRPPAPQNPSGRLSQMDLEPPAGPVPASVLAYFEAALDREDRRRAA